MNCSAFSVPPSVINENVKNVLFYGQTLANRTKPGPSLQVAGFMLPIHFSVKQNSLA